MRWLILVVVLFSFAANAGDVTLSWTAPTQNEDGSPYTDPDGYKLYSGSVSGGPYLLIRDVPDPATLSVDIVGLAAGTYYFVATAYNTSGEESVDSNEATKVIFTVPNPPGMLTVQDLVVYTLIRQPDKFVLIPVGTVPAGTSCDPTNSINGHYAVPVSDVTWSGTVESIVVVAQCG